MEAITRRQLHSCDHCRKGKRRCDAPKDRKESGFSLCSNCRRWNKKCTFNWVSAKRVNSIGPPRRNKGNASAKSHNGNTFSATDSPDATWDRDFPFSQWYSPNLSDIITPEVAVDSAFAPSSHTQGSFLDGSDGTESNGDQADFPPENVDIPIDWQFNAATQDPNDVLAGFQSHPALHDLLSNSSAAAPSSTELMTSRYRQAGREYASASNSDQGFSPGLSFDFCNGSENIASQCARSTMTRNLIRIYHDSMENALSCWLTEHNCPYSDLVRTVMPHTERKEWGPSWSNRMCIRICQLDRASSSIRGRALSAEEDKTAARVLHLAIVAFASQWTQHAQKGIGLSVPGPISRDERSIREYVWNEARSGLERSSRIPSFRIIFANIIFSLTQSPLENGHDKGLSELLENDGAPTFLEAANRQLYTFRHKFVRLMRETPPRAKELRRGSIGSSVTDSTDTLESSRSPPLDPILAVQEHRDTLSLLFWLGVMFDTLSAAMYQRPLVVSDEDSQIASASPDLLVSEKQMQRDPAKHDVWGEFFLHTTDQDTPSRILPRWPCSYEAAASVLSEATPVKVLLYRRVTQLQTLVYRGASSDRLEDIIEKTLLVYQHWNSTYQGFMLDCVENHELLPSRIQSWYVILDGHWHLATLLLADTIEGIDNGRLSTEGEREARRSTEFVSKLRTEHAFAVGALARASLHGQNPSMHRHFHDSLSEVAFLVEPWTVVLIHSFAKAATISLDSLSMPGEHDMLFDPFRQNCEICICALQYLGRKSDMAFMLARNLSKSLGMKLAQMP